MASISAPDLVLLRTGKFTCTPYLSVLQPATLLTAEINDAGIERGDRSIAYASGAGAGFALIEPGQTFEVDTADGTKKARVKSITGNQTAGTIVLDENAIDFANGQTIRIKFEYRVWPIAPRISGGVFYKLYDTAYSDQNHLPPPVAIAGPHQAGFMAGGSLTFTISAAGSYAIAQGATIATYAWSCNGGSITSATAATTTITFDTAGQYWLKLVVTDSNGKTQSTFRALFVHDASYMPYTKFDVNSVSGSWQSGGYRAAFSVNGPATIDDFPDGTLVLLWYEGRINTVVDYINLWTGGDNLLFSGYIRADNDTDDYSSGAGAVEFSAVSPEGILDEMTEFGTVSITAVTTTPVTWYEYASWLTVGRAVHHLLRWHSTALSCFDVFGLLDNVLGMESANFTESSLLQQVNSLGFNRGHFAKLVSDRTGRLHFATDSQYLNDAGRAALDTVFSITNNDISGAINITRQPEGRIGYCDLDGFAFDGTTGTPFISIAPGYIDTISISMAEFVGVGGTPIKNQVLDDQTDSNEKAGRVLAVANNPINEVRLDMPANYSGAFDIVPSIGWYDWGIANSSLKRALPLFGKNLVCRSVENRIGVGAGTIQTSVILEPEADGADGIPGNYPTGYPAVANPPGPSWNEPEAPFDVETPVELFVGNVGGISLAPLTENTALLVIQDNDDSFKLKGIVLTVTAGVLTAGSPSTVISTTAGSFQITRADSDKALLVYEDAADGSKCKARVLSVSGDTVTPNTAATVTDGLTGFITVDRFGTSSNFITFFNESGGATNLGACILAVSGTAVIAFTPATVENNSDLKPLGVACHLSNDAVGIYTDVSDNNTYGVVLNNAAGTITPGAVEDLSIDNTSILSGGGTHQLTAVTGDKVAFTHFDSGFFIRTVFISGDSITLNPAAAGGLAVAKVSSSEVFAAWPELDIDDPGILDIFEIAGSATTSTGNQTEFEAADIDMIDVCYLSGGYGIIVYRKDVNNDAFGILVTGGPL